MTSKKSKAMSDESTYNRCFIFFEYQACFEFKRPKSLLLENRKTHKPKIWPKMSAARANSSYAQICIKVYIFYDYVSQNDYYIINSI